MTAPTPETGQPSVWSGPRHVFVAGMPQGGAGFTLAASVAPQLGRSGRSVLDAASALAAAEPWLQAFEDWLGCGLRPALSPLQEQGAAQRLFGHHLMLQHAGLGATFHLPHAALQHGMPAPPEVLAGWWWRPVTCQLLLDTVALSPTDLRTLEPGALVLIPASFDAAWLARLQAVGQQGVLCGARMHTSRGRLCLSPDGAATAPPPQHHAALRLGWPVDVPAHELMGWPQHEGATPVRPRPLEQGTVVIHGAGPVAGRRLACGQLMRVGRGYGVRIDHCFAEPPSEPRRAAPVASTSHPWT